MSKDHMDIDFDNLVDPNEPAPDGAYDVTFNKAELTESKAGDEMVVLSMQITGNPEHDGKFIQDYLVIGHVTKRVADGARWRLKEYFQAAGVKPGLDNLPKLVGATISVELSVQPGSEEYPNPSNRIRRVYV
jgi:hypothetical protein